MSERRGEGGGGGQGGGPLVIDLPGERGREVREGREGR